MTCLMHCIISRTVHVTIFGLGGIEVGLDDIDVAGVFSQRMCFIAFTKRGTTQQGRKNGKWEESLSYTHTATTHLIVMMSYAFYSTTQKDEFLVISTDGLWDVMPPRDAMLYARKELLKGKTPQEVRFINHPSAP